MTVEKVIPALATAGMSNGDLFYWHAADAEFKQLAAGTDTHVLTLASGLPSWAAGGSSTDANHCRINLTANYTSLATGSWTTLEWDSNVAVTDPQSMLYDTLSNPDKIRPTATGRYLATFNCAWENNTTGRRIAAIYHLNSSGNALGRIASQQQSQNFSELSIAGIFEIGTADSEYLIVRVFQDSGGLRYLLGLPTPITWGSGGLYGTPEEQQTWFGLQRLSA